MDMTLLPAPTEPDLDPAKFQDPFVTAKGEERAAVALSSLRTLWFNTGSLCNITCVGCYMDSSPTNDRLAYISHADVVPYLDEIVADGWPVEEIGFTGGEPFMNRALPAILEDVLDRGFRALVLTNAMKPMWHKRDALLAHKARHGDRLELRVSVDHHTPHGHEAVRGPSTWAPMLKGLRWLSQNGFNLAVAGRTLWNEPEDAARAAYARLFEAEGIVVDSTDPARLVLFPEMNEGADVPEITTQCWTILDVDPASVMCATSRMVVKHKGDAAPRVMPCTLLPYDRRFEMGRTLAEGDAPVRLNHPHCAKFCVLGGASCSV